METLTLKMALNEISFSYYMNKMKRCLSFHWQLSLLHYSVTFNISFLNKVSKPLVGSKMAITFELKLCLSNSSRRMERKTEDDQSTNITLIFTSPVDLFLIPYFRPISANFKMRLTVRPNFLKFGILNSLMPLIMCTKFQINQIILTLFSGVWDKNPTPVAEKVIKCRRQ